MSFVTLIRIIGNGCVQKKKKPNGHKYYSFDWLSKS